MINLIIRQKVLGWICKYSVEKNNCHIQILHNYKELNLKTKRLKKKEMCFTLIQSEYGYMAVISSVAYYFIHKISIFQSKKPYFYFITFYSWVMLFFFDKYI